MGKTLIISVGGSLEPVICSIKYHAPENIIFFTSVETEPQVIEILKNIELQAIKSTDKIVTSSAENIHACLCSLLNSLPGILSRWKPTPEEIIVDYTGGTKSMSAAIVLATIKYSKRFSFIGGEKRNKEGIGVVIAGQEKALILGNPWDELAIEEKKNISLLFNNGRYLAAKEAAHEARKKVSLRQKPFWETLENLTEAYYQWDSFDYENANHQLKKVVHELKKCASQIPNNNQLLTLLEKVEENQKFLQILITGSENEVKTEKGAEKTLEREIKKEEYRLLDLLANAKRRAEIEKRYDDAIVRIYRAIEKRAQIELIKYGLDASNIDLNLVPQRIRNEIKEKHTDQQTNKIKVPLYASYKILQAKEEEKGLSSIGHKFFDQYKSIIRPLLDLRNNSIIIHGKNSLTEEKYQTAWNYCLRFLEISDDSLPRFPELAF